MPSEKINPHTNKRNGKIKLLETKPLNPKKYTMNNPSFTKKSTPQSVKKKANIYSV